MAPDLTPPLADDPPWPEPRTDGPGPQDAFRVPFTPAIGLALVLWTFLAQLLVGTVAAVGGMDFDDPTQLRIIIIAAQVVTLAGALGTMQSSGRLSWRLAGPVRPQSKDVAVGVAVGVGGYVIVLLWAIAFGLVFGEPEPVEQSLLQDVSSSTPVIVTSVLAAVLMAPIVEEVVFRGVLFQALRRQVGLWPAALLSGVVWTAVHVELFPPVGSFQPVAIGAIFLLAIWLAWIFHRTGTIVVAVLGHATFNAINLGIAVLSSG